MLPVDITRTSHVAYRVTNLDAASEFYVDRVGFVETARDAHHLYLRGLEDRVHHNLVLIVADRPGFDHVAFRVRRSNDLDTLAEWCNSQSLSHHWTDHSETGVGKSLRIIDPFGFPVEFIHEVTPVEWNLQRFDAYHGAEVMRLDHVNYVTPKITDAYRWYTEHLGFECSEYTVSQEPEGERIWGVWLARKGTSHDLAIANGVGPRMHHASFIAASKESLLHVADVLAATGYHTNLERGPGRHGTTNAFFLYLRDPDGNRIELFTGDYLRADPDLKPIAWNLDDPRRATFWGSEAPARWFNETMDVFSWGEDTPIPTTASPLRDRPKS